MKLYDFQEKALKRTAKLNKVAYYYDMGLGKSYIGVAKIQELNKKVNLVICQKSKVKDWIDIFQQNTSFKVCNLTKPREMNEFIKLNVKKVGIINYELFWRREELSQYLIKIDDYSLVLDESSEIQNEKTKQCKAILKLEPQNVILLSGTPVGGKYENLWSQLRLLGYKPNAWQFRQRYVNYEDLYIGGGMTVKVINPRHPYKRVEELKSTMAQLNCDFLKTEEVLDLPSQRDIIISCDTPKEFSQFVKNDIVEINGVKLIGENTLTKRLRCKQICSIYNKSRLQVYTDLINSTSDRLIVFYQFTEELKQLENVSVGRPMSVVNGEYKQLDNYERCSDSITFVQYQAGAMGLNLQKANKMIFYSLCDSSNLYEQARKRIHRIGQSFPCTYYIIQCDDGIDKNIYNALLKKSDYTDALFIKDYTEWQKRKGLKQKSKII